MSTGYLGSATTPDSRLSDLEQRVARLETELERREHKAEMERMSALVLRVLGDDRGDDAIIVYLAASLD